MTPLRLPDRPVVDEFTTAVGLVPPQQASGFTPETTASQQELELFRLGRGIGGGPNEAFVDNTVIRHALHALRGEVGFAGVALFDLGALVEQLVLRDRIHYLEGHRLGSDISALDLGDDLADLMRPIPPLDPIERVSLASWQHAIHWGEDLKREATEFSSSVADYWAYILHLSESPDPVRIWNPVDSTFGTDPIDMLFGPREDELWVGRVRSGELPFPTDRITIHNYRALVNLCIAFSLTLPYEASITRLPVHEACLRQAPRTSALATVLRSQPQLLQQGLDDAARAEIERRERIFAGTQVPVPLWLGIALSRVDRLDQLLGAILELREEATPLRDRYREACSATSHASFKEVNGLVDAFANDVERFSTANAVKLSAAMVTVGLGAIGGPAWWIVGLIGAATLASDDHVSQKIVENLWRQDLRFLRRSRRTLEAFNDESSSKIKQLWRLSDDSIDQLAAWTSSLSGIPTTA